MTTMTENELTELLNSADPDDIDKAIAYMAKKEDVTAEPSSGKPSTQGATTEETDVTAGSSTADVDAPKGVQSKNGEHVLPYAVLEQSRHEAQEAKRQLQLAQQQVADATTQAEHAEALQRQIALLTQQLEKAGLTPVKLDENEALTEEELEALDEYGDVGAVSKKAARKVVALEAQVKELLKLTQQAPSQQPVAEPAGVTEVHQAIAAVDGLSEVMRDKVLSAKAVAIDDKLQADPKWANKPMVERFSEVMRQLAPTLLHQDSTNAKKSKAAFDPDRVDPPMSINGITTHQADTADGLASIFDGLSEEEVQAKYLSLTPAQQASVNQLLGW